MSDPLSDYNCIYWISSQLRRSSRFQLIRYCTHDDTVCACELVRSGSARLLVRRATCVTHARADTCSFPFPFSFTHVSRVTFIACLLANMSRHRRSFTYTDVAVTSSRSSSGLDACLSNRKSRVMFCGFSTSCFKVILSDELHYSCKQVTRSADD